MNIISISEYLNKLYYKNEFLENIFNLLSQLTESPIINLNDFITTIKNLPDNHFIYLYFDENKSIPVGIITLIIEQKLIHNCKCVGHIEDLVVDKEYNGKGIARELINYCINKCKLNNCYKIILDCKKELIPFYNKNNFIEQGVCMRMNL